MTFHTGRPKRDRTSAHRRFVAVELNGIQAASCDRFSKQDIVGVNEYPDFRNTVARPLRQTCRRSGIDVSRAGGEEIEADIFGARSQYGVERFGRRYTANLDGGGHGRFP